MIRLKSLLRESFSEVHFTGTNAGARGDEVIIHYDNNFDPIRAYVYKDSPLVKFNPDDWEITDPEEMAKWKWPWKRSSSTMLSMTKSVPSFVWWIKELGYVEHRNLSEIYDDPTRWAYRNKVHGPKLPRSAATKKYKTYTLHFMKDVYEEYSDIFAVDSNGEIVGTLFFGKPAPQSNNIEGAIEIHPDHRRKGLASEMYKWAEELSGMVIKPSYPHSAAASKFWNQPNIGFGPMKGIQEMEDYHHSMDYDEDFRPPQKVKEAVEGILKQTKKLQDALGLKSVRIGYIARDRQDALARYINGTMDNPYFVISGRTLLNAAKKYGMNLWTAVETTLVHEFGHAYLEMCGIDVSDHDEDVVEEFAREYNDFHDIVDAKKILDDFVTSQ